MTSQVPVLPLFLIEFAKGVFAGNPTALRVTEHVKATLWADETSALAKARELGGQVIAWTPPAGAAAALHILARRSRPTAIGESRSRLALVPPPPPVAPIAARRRGGPKAETPTPASPTPALAARPAKPQRSAGPSRDEVMELVKASGLLIAEKSSTHAGDPKGARLVVPRAATVTRLFAYKLTDPSTPGFRTAEERRAEGLGAVTNVADVPDMDAVRLLLEAVRVANGLPATAPPKAAVPRKRPRKATPAGGTPTVTSTGEQAPLGEAPAGDLGGTTPEASSPAEVTAEVPDAEGPK